MASCSDLTKLSSTTSYRPIIKATPVPILTSRKLVEPFNRLKNRANLFRRKNYSSHLDISDPRSSLPADHFISSHRITTTDNNSLVLKRSNSMICPQQRLQTLLNNNNVHNSICVGLSGCQTDECSFVKSSSNRHYGKKPYSKMSHINEQDVISSRESLIERNIEGKKKNIYQSRLIILNLSFFAVSSLPNNNNQQTSVIFSSPQSTKNVNRGEEQKQQLTPSVPSSSSTLISRDNAAAIQTCRPSNSLYQRQSICSSCDEPFYDCKQQASPIKSTQHFDMSLPKISTYTMTGKSLNNLDECLSTTSSEDKCVQTTFNDSISTNSSHKRNNSSTSLSSSSTSIQTDSLENKPKISILSKTDQPSKHFIDQPQTELRHKWTNIHERLLNEQTCIYWVNYLGSTAIKISNDNTPAMPTHAICRLKQSTQYARVLPIIGLSISSRGVEFLKHTKDRVVICFHDIKSIHCACQDQDLRYFAYVTREQRLTNGISHSPTTFDHKQKPPPPSPSLSINADYHNYCHVFVVKNESMSTEILLTFGQAFDIAYQLHRRLNSKYNHLDKSHTKIDVNHLSTKSDKMKLSSAHSPTTSSSASSSSIEERRVFV